MHRPNFSLQEVKQIDIVDYLEKIGYQPQKISNNDYWFLSPLRAEKEASFKVNRTLNVWYDFGMGQGGTLIDFGLLYHHCNVSELLVKLHQFFSFHPQTLTVQQPLQHTQILRQKALEPKIKVIAAKPLTNPALCRYLNERKIPFEIAEKYCKEVHFELHDKKNFAIGFENKSGGFELRNEFFKGSSSPKDVTQISTAEAKEISVFEGFFSFLSYHALQQNNHLPMTNFLVLNSLSFFEKSREIMEKNEKVYLYLDRDSAGVKKTESTLKWSEKYFDKSMLYQNHKDLNEFLKSQHPRINQGLKLERHF